mmetsp:Transcript_16169/g.44797  ORF Transcript_16169/g.44797 Transcript_16169/m.44797 type:complete len:260 (-) Transcript_16169:238-1017(-)
MIRKRIALFGGTGRTGRSFLRSALQDHDDISVTVLVRNPDKLGSLAHHPRLTTVHGSLEDPSCVEETLRDSTHVVCMIAAAFCPNDEYPRGCMTIFAQQLTLLLSHMEEKPKVVIYQAGGLSTDGSGKRHWISSILGPTKYKFMLNKIHDNDQVIQFLAQNSPIPYIITRAGSLFDEEATVTAEAAAAAGGADASAQVGLLEAKQAPELCLKTPPLPWDKVSYQSLALITLELLDEESMYGKCPYVVPMKRKCIPSCMM